MPIGATIGVAGLAGAGATAYSANRASNAQTTAAANATAQQRQMFDVTQQNLAPFIGAGGNALGTLGGLTGVGGDPMTSALTRPFQPTMDQLRQTPGYQFTLDEGLKSAQNSYAAKGLGSSGAAMRGAVDYAGGLASTTYQQQFQNDLASRQNIFNMLYPQAQMGASAAAGLGQQATQVGGQIGSNMIGAGNAQAGAAMATGNAFGGALTGGVNQYLQYNMLQRMLANSGNAPTAMSSTSFGGGLFG